MFLGGDPEEVVRSFGGMSGGFCGLGIGRNSGIGILLRCTLRLDGGLYVFDGGPSSLMRRGTVGWVSYTTYW
jgi:hypothetical protein